MENISFQCKLSWESKAELLLRRAELELQEHYSLALFHCLYEIQDLRVPDIQWPYFQGTVSVHLT